MSLIEEWHHLGYLLEEDSYHNQKFGNQYFNRLVNTLLSTNASPGDIASAYRDALLASPDTGGGHLRLRKLSKIDPRQLSTWGLLLNTTGQYLSLAAGTGDIHHIDRYGISLQPVYALEERRHIQTFPMDPVLTQKIGAAGYEVYQGAGQKTAVRLALTAPSNATLVVNLPTGVGKTLVTYALSAFTGDRRLTLVIVPTIGLAIDQGTRAKVHFEQLDTGHGGSYHWYGDQEPSQQADIRQRILDGNQRILFCSPESATKSLLPVLFEAARCEILGSVVVDEAHMVEQWGLGFRPYFQIFSALLHKFRGLCAGNIKCILMSATLPAKTVRNLMDLFSTEGTPRIEIHGGFLRPEPQYSVMQVDKDKHLAEIVRAVKLLPKPLIVYTTQPHHAAEIESALKFFLHINRVRTFTGHTNSQQRETILHAWDDNQLDVIVATSAFGLGMNKPDVRSIIHASYPENLDRYYQEVGRAGRDGLACQALMIYHSAQMVLAERINTKRLISVEKGLDRWQTMWKLGTVAPGGCRIVDVRSLRGVLRRRSDSNVEWNWRTLLLMQRSGMIKIQFEEPDLPVQAPSDSSQEFEQRRSDYYDQYFGCITVEPIIDSHLEEGTWRNRMALQRIEEQHSQEVGYQQLYHWSEHSSEIALCHHLADFYSCHGIQPEYSCGGCPACRRRGRQAFSPTVGLDCTVRGQISPSCWRAPIVSDQLHIRVYYDETIERNPERLIRRWRGWISRLIESGAIQAIRAEPQLLEILNQRLSRGLDVFWIGSPLVKLDSEQKLWRELVIVSPNASVLPDLGWEESPRLLVAPKSLPHPDHYQCKWWERDHRAKPLSSFLRELDYVTHQ